MNYRSRFQQVLVNPSQEDSLEREPLLAFSFYLSGRVATLSAFAEEIQQNLDVGFKSDPIDGGRVERAESLMWLWILGTYEVIRTMDQAKPCFSDRVRVKLLEYKHTLEEVRMPAAKMEKRRHKKAVSSNRSPTGWCIEKSDLWVNDPEERLVSARELLNQFDALLCSILRSDVLAHHSSQYPD